MPFRHTPLPRLIFRVGWGDDPLAYAPLPILLAGVPGRWDDVKYRFRTGYFADSLETGFIEVLAGLRPDPKTVARLRAMAAPLPNLDLAVEQTLEHKYASVVITERDPIVDIVHPHSRTEFEVRTHRTNSVKPGDFLARNRRVARRAAGVVHDTGGSGIAAPSAEALGRGGMAFPVFETAVGSGRARVSLIPHLVRPAVEERIGLATARDFLGI